jgi:phosphatidate cytidylyltransferase
MASTSRAGRDLSSAILVGVILAACVIGSLALYGPAFLVIVVIAVVIAVHELAIALRAGGLHPPLAPLTILGPLVPILGWWRGLEDATIGFLVLLLAVAGWRVAAALRGRVGFTGDGRVTRDVAAGVFTAVYVPYLGTFVVLVLAQPEGDLRVLTWIGCVVFSDIGGYAVGVLTGGRHKMAPLISPGKSWEGFVGSLLFSSVWGAAFAVHALGEDWWKGVVLGCSMATAAVLGDLLESVVKRDLGIKDMGQLLPGHGGLMDRIDSILFAAPVAWAVLGALLT